MNFIENLKVGDKVIMMSGDARSVHVVSRFTKTQILTKRDSQNKYEHRFRKSDGRVVGATVWSSSRLIEFSEEEFIEIAKANNRRKWINIINKHITNWDALGELSNDQLRRMAEIVLEEKS